MVDSGLSKIKKLVDKFSKCKNDYQNTNEEDTKVEFINQFFKALGWNIDNKEEKSPRFKEVVF